MLRSYPTAMISGCTSSYMYFFLLSEMSAGQLLPLLQRAFAPPVLVPLYPESRQCIDVAFPLLLFSLQSWDAKPLRPDNGDAPPSESTERENTYTSSLLGSNRFLPDSVTLCFWTGGCRVRRSSATSLSSPFFHACYLTLFSHFLQMKLSILPAVPPS